VPLGVKNSVNRKAERFFVCVASLAASPRCATLRANCKEQTGCYSLHTIGDKDSVEKA
jgi:hypothetical protein